MPHLRHTFMNLLPSGMAMPSVIRRRLCSLLLHKFFSKPGGENKNSKRFARDVTRLHAEHKQRYQAEIQAAHIPTLGRGYLVIAQLLRALAPEQKKQPRQRKEQDEDQDKVGVHDRQRQ